MAQNLNEQKCPACGAPLRFDPETGKSVCDWCGTSYEIEADDGQRDKDAKTEAAQDEICVYSCVSCGAEIITDAVSASVKCPYCGNNIVITEKVTGGLRPDGIIPFKIDKKALPEAVRKFYKDKPLLPKGFFSESSIEEVCGIYVPFWVYSSLFKGNANYRAWKESAVRQGDYLITTRKNYKVVRGVTMRFADMPVDASTRLDDALMDSVMPFHFYDLVPFSMSYLAGFFADRFDIDSEELRKRAEDRMWESMLSITDQRAVTGYSGFSRSGHTIKAAERVTRYALLPVYTFSVNWGGKKYSFAMNGQTGKVVGSLPTDNKKKLLIRWGSFAAIAAAIMLLLSSC